MAAAKSTPNAHNFQDLAGKTFGRLKVIKRDPREKRKVAFWVCECECGNGYVVAAFYLTSGKRVDCGCMRGSRWKSAMRDFHASHPQPTARAICLTNGLAVVVDNEDYDLVSQYWWSPHKGNTTTYARATIGENHVLMHVFLMGEIEGKTVDHVNGNGLDNRRENLRYATPSQQSRNRHGGRGRSLYKGVSWARRQRKWAAAIHLDGTNKHLGYFDSEDAAAKAYDAAALEHYGSFACLNFPAGGGSF